MFGAEFPEFLLFFKQLGLALAGAASLWGFVFARWSKHKPNTQDCLVYEWVGMRLLLLIAGGIALTLASWVFFPASSVLQAHEGIVLVAPQEQAFEAFEKTAPFLILWLSVFLLGMGAKKFWPKPFSINLEWFYALNLVFAVFLMMLFAWQGDVDRNGFFFWGHALHSILTVGSVLVLDFLFLVSRPSSVLKQHIYPLFPTISKVIWVGLGIDFLSVALVFEQAIALTPKFFFMQTVVGILIINGALLAGPIARKMMNAVAQGNDLSKRWTRIGSVAGAISATSWLTITFVDSFERLTLSYVQLFLFYLIALAALFIAHELWERVQKEPSLT